MTLNRIVLMLPVVMLCALAPQAQAAAIVNLASTSQTVEIEIAGNYRPIVIERWRTWRVIGPARVRYEGRVSYIEDDEEYAIWNDGTFGPQRRERRGIGHLL
jgi:hypothetical protein